MPVRWSDSPLFAPVDDPDETSFREGLAEALARLPNEQRAAVHWKLWQSLTFQEKNAAGVSGVFGIQSAYDLARCAGGFLEAIVLMTSPPVALTIAGSDNSAGAGMQADLKTFGALGVYGLTAVTCVVAEVPGKVTRIQAMEPEMVAEQIRLCFEAFPVAAVKTGMLFSQAIIEAVAHALPVDGPPLVVDPVMIASSGDALLQPDAVLAYCDLLFPRAVLLTPNLDEARALLGRDIFDLARMRTAAADMRERFGCDILLKGGHLGTAEAIDILVTKDGSVELAAPFIAGVDTHGTGCTYAAAIAAGLACELPLEEAVRRAKEFVSRAIAEHFRWPQGAGVTDALNHHRLRGA